MKAGARPALWTGPVVAVGLLLSAGAFYERFDAPRSGREYLFCHASEAVDHLTFTALALVLAAVVASVVGGIVVWRSKPRNAVLPLCCMAVVVALLMAADGVDAHGEGRAAEIAAQGFTEAGCDYTPQVYDATPGWFYW